MVHRGKRGAEQVSSEEFLVAGIQAAVETYEWEKDGKVPPVHAREYALAKALRKIARGEVKLREMRAYAVQVLERWQEQREGEGV
jgi:hypothetical protein